MEQAKPWYLSKTLWTNFLLTVVVMIVPKGTADFIKQPEMLASVFAIVNFVLRIISKDKLTIS